MGNSLYYGDNLWVLKDYIPSESVDLIYLDPPFNSSAAYNVLFSTPDGEASGAQAEAFLDTWRWNDQSEASFDAMMAAGGQAAEILRALRSFLGTSDMMAYLANMAIRLHEMRRCMRPTASLYLHCDANASHYLKILLDGVFGPKNFRNEITWKRANAHNDPKRYGRISDSLLFYTATDDYTWNPQYTPYREDYYKSHYKQDERGRYYRTVPLDAPKHGQGSPGLLYEWKGKMPSQSRTWAIKREKMEQYEKDGLLRYTRTGTPTLLQYADEMPGVALQSIWTDIPPVNPQAKERIGYPTQKPVALLKRIISASSNPGDIVLDPFCGCGTTVHAAQELGRQWTGVDVAHYAVGVIEDRLREEFGASLAFDVVGRPMELEAARDLASRDKYQFQWWANWLVGVQNYKERRKGADSGIDGIIYFRNGPLGTGRVIVSVKGGDHIGPDMIRALAGTVERDKADLGLFVCVTEPSANMRREAAALGLVKTAHGKYPKIQIITIEDLLQRKQPNLPPRYEVSDDELTLRKGRPKSGDPQMGFTFSIRGDKDSNVYPAEKLIARAWKNVNHPQGAIENRSRAAPRSRERKRAST